ncbi:hypothetical protein Tco_0266803 [Tanacetum coccineum]
MLNECQITISFRKYPRLLFSNSPELSSFQTIQAVNKTNVSDGLCKQVTQQNNLPQIRKQAVLESLCDAPGPLGIPKACVISCLYSANHDECVLEYLSRLNPRASAQNEDAKSHKTTNRYMPVAKSGASKKPERPIPTGHRFSNKKTATVPEKTITPRSCLSWKPTGRIFKTIGLRWVSTRKIFAFSTNKVDSEPAHGSIVDIPHIQASKQTLGLSAETSARMVLQKMSYIRWRLLEITLQAPFLNVHKTFDRSRSSLGLHGNDVCSHQFRPRSSLNDF